MAQDIYSGLAEGLQGGMNMGLALGNARQAKREREWQHDLMLYKLNFEGATTKGIGDKSKLNYLTNMNAAAKRIDPKHVDVELTPANMEGYYDMVANPLQPLFKKVSEDPA